MRYSPVPHVAVLAAALTGAFGAAFLLSGCQDGSGNSETSADQQPRSAADRASSSASDDTEPVQAADGTDLDACRDADCQVELEVGDILRPEIKGLPLDTITVQNVASDRVELSMAGGTGKGMTLQGVDMSVTSKCVGERCQDSGELTVTTKTPGKINHVKVRVDQMRDNRAILTFEPGSKANLGSKG